MKLGGFFLFCLLLTLILFVVVYLISFSVASFQDKGGSFECGFYNFSGSSLSFSMPFLLFLLCFCFLMWSSFWSVFTLWVVVFLFIGLF